MQHPRSNGRIADLVDQDETAKRVIIEVGFEHDGFICRNFGDTYGVQLQRLRRHMLHSVNVDGIFGHMDGRRHHLRAELQPISPSGD